MIISKALLKKAGTFGTLVHMLVAVEAVVGGLLSEGISALFCSCVILVLYGIRKFGNENM